MGDNDEWKNMFQELTGYEKKNISLRINGIPASPMQIVLPENVREILFQRSLCCHPDTAGERINRLKTR